MKEVAQLFLREKLEEGWPEMRDGWSGVGKEGLRAKHIGTGSSSRPGRCCFVAAQALRGELNRGRSELGLARRMTEAEVAEVRASLKVPLL